MKKDAPRARRSRRFRVVLLVGAVVAIAGAVWLATFRRDPTRELRAAASAFLTRATDGRKMEAYAQADDKLKAEVEYGVFDLLADGLTEAGGRFLGITRVRSTGVTRIDGDATEATLVVDARFEKRELPVELGFTRREGWRVSSFAVDYPPDVWPAPDAAALTRDSTQFLDWLAASDYAAMYARFYPDVWTRWKPSVFEADIQRLHSVCKGLRAEAPQTVGTNSSGMTLVEARVVCASGESLVARLKWTWLHGKWRLMGVSWVVPDAAPRPEAAEPAPLPPDAGAP